jgi:hypothetical protein
MADDCDLPALADLHIDKVHNNPAQVTLELGELGFYQEGYQDGNI